MFHLLSLYNSTSELQKAAQLSDKDAPDTDQLLEICLATTLFWLKLPSYRKRLLVLLRSWDPKQTHTKRKNKNCLWVESLKTETSKIPVEFPFETLKCTLVICLEALFTFLFHIYLSMYLSMKAFRKCPPSLQLHSSPRHFPHPSHFTSCMLGAGQAEFLTAAVWSACIPAHR